MNGDGSGRRPVAEHLADNADAWTSFAGWSPDGKQAIISRGWQDPENAKWEEEHKRFRMLPGKWELDSSLVELATGKTVNVTAVGRVSHYNSVSFRPDGRKLLMTSLINGVSKPFLMDLDGRNKRDVSGEGSGFTYGYSASPDGGLISYHSNYQVYIANADGTNKRHIKTGNPFDFAPRWSGNGQWLLFVSGVHGRSNPHIVRRDGTALRKLADLGGYQGWILFLDVPDFHQGSSDIPVWSADGNSVFYTAKVGENVELFQVTLEGKTKQLTKSAPGTLHYHIRPSANGRWLLYGSMRDGVRQLFVRDLTSSREKQLTNLKRGHAAMWAHWQPAKKDKDDMTDVRKPQHTQSHDAMVDELETLEINGTRQWVLCRGEDRTKPVVLFVHGGPGYPLMWFSRAFDDVLLKDFVVVHWDQRNAGKSYSPDTPTETFTLDQIVDDGLKVTERVKRKFDVDKIILVGHSWGTMVAANMAKRRPTNFRAYVAIGTAADWKRAEALRYAQLQKLAHEKNDQNAIADLKDLGPPPFLSSKRYERFGELIVRLDGFRGTSRKLTEEQLAQAIRKNKEYTEDEIAIGLEALKGNLDLLADFLNEYVLMNAVPKLDVPVYFVQGRHDMNTPTSLAKEYFDTLVAPQGKHWIVFDDAAHMAMYEEPEKFFQVLQSTRLSTAAE